jgi:hypothetical protein
MILSRKEPEQPRRRSTARGGRKIAIRASQQPAWGVLVFGLVDGRGMVWFGFGGDVRGPWLWVWWCWLCWNYLCRIIVSK